MHRISSPYILSNLRRLFCKRARLYSEKETHNFNPSPPQKLFYGEDTDRERE